MVILDWIGKIIVTVGINKLVSLIKDAISKYEAIEQSKKEAQAASQEMQSAKNGDEIDKASSDTLNHL